jgi:putative spermidine/putrescine transport system substrate-binding protein
MRRLWICSLLILALALAACGAPASTSAPTAASAAAPTSATAAPAAGFEDSFRTMSYDQIAAAAKGQTVNWYMWGGDDSINKYVNGYLAQQLKDTYGITLKQVPVKDTVEVVNKVLAEKQAGKHKDGSVDLIWINGENFRTMKEGQALFRNWADLLPSNKFIDWKSPAIANDFGYPVEYDESPWGAAQFVMEYDSAKVPSPPKTVEELFSWACANKGKLAYPAPPDFTGSVFVRHAFYAAAGDYTNLLGAFDEAKYNQIAPKTWKMLNDVEPCLWRAGETYPESNTKLYDLFANGEVWISMSYGPAHAANEIAKGHFPKTTRTWVFDSGTIGNTNYVAIPYNSPNKAAAMVLANVLLSPEAQLEAAKPEVMGWSTPLFPSLLPKETAAKFDAIPRDPSTLDNHSLSENKLSELQATWLTRIEKDWKAEVLER